MSTKIYKSKADINYITFKNFSEVIEGNDSDSFIERQTIEYFNPDSMANFAEALQTNPKAIKMPYKLDLTFKTAGKFIDCDTFVNRETRLADEQVLDFLKIVLKPRYFGQKVDLNKLSIAQVEYCTTKFIDVADEIKRGYEWIYNPPTFPSANAEITQGLEERQEFSRHYGGYMHMAILLMKNGFGTIDEITNWSLDKYLFLGEMFNRRDIIENLK